MSKPTSFNALFLGVGLACAALLVWLWRQSAQPVEAPHPPAESPVAKAEVAPASSSSTASSETATLTPELRAMITALARALARGEARDREAVLGFKDDAS